MSSSSEKSGVRSSGEEGGADVSERGEAMRRDRLEVSEAPRAALRLPLPGTEGCRSASECPRRLRDSA